MEDCHKKLDPYAPKGEQKGHVDFGDRKPEGTQRTEKPGNSLRHRLGRGCHEADGRALEGRENQTGCEEGETTSELDGWNVLQLRQF